jgi:hypothetical protein
MCEFEQNILKLLVEEKERLKPLVDKQIPLPYYKGLENGIESAQKKLKQCEYEKCIQTVYREQARDLIPMMDLKRWSAIQFGLSDCKTD